MMSPTLELLIAGLQRFAGIGPKSAQRMAFQVLKWAPEDVAQLAEVMLHARQTIQPCQRCHYLTEEDYCVICTSTSRDATVLTVVAEVADVMALENTHHYKGRYHVLGGLLSPLDGVGPDQLNIATLMSRLAEQTPQADSPLQPESIQEVILALPPSVEGDTTTLYLHQQLQGLVHTTSVVPKVSRISFGLPVGGELEYADAMTLSRALQGRTAVA